MLTKEQEVWVASLNGTRTIAILPYDPTSSAKFEQIKKKITDHFGDRLTVLHEGASSLKISGQQEIDIYVPVPAKEYDEVIREMSKVFGEPKKRYPERTRFWDKIDETIIQLFVTNQDTEEWRTHRAFRDKIVNDPEVRARYIKHKEAGNGLTVQEYYRRKCEFINDVLGVK